jgi:hypothetical protein
MPTTYSIHISYYSLNDRNLIKSVIMLIRNVIMIKHLHQKNCLWKYSMVTLIDFNEPIILYLLMLIGIYIAMDAVTTIFKYTNRNAWIIGLTPTTVAVYHQTSVTLNVVHYFLSNDISKGGSSCGTTCVYIKNHYQLQL